MRDENQAEAARKGVPAGVLVAMLLSGCLAQQSDLIETKVDLDNKIEKLNKKEREIQIQVDQANTSIIDQEKKVNDLVNETRARIRSEISELRDDSMPRIQGTLEEHSKRLGDLRKASEDRDARVDQLLAKRDADSEKRFAALGAAQKADRDHLYEELVRLGTRLDETNKSVVEVAKRLDARLQEHDRALGAGDAKTGGLTQQLDQQGRTLTEQMGQFGRALADFKQVLSGLNEKLLQQERMSQELSANLTRRTDALAARAEADAKATSSYLAEVNRSVGSVAKALETMGGTFVTRIEQQDRRLGEMAGALQAVTSQVEALNQGAAQHREAPETGGTKRGTKPHKRVGEVEREHKPGQRAGQPAGLEPVAQAPPANDPSLQTQPGTEAPGQQVAQAQAVPAAPSPTASEPPAPVPDQVPGSGKPSAKEMYEATLSKFRQGDLEEAQRGFTEFLAQHSTSELAPNAQYWLGECYYGKRDYQRAIEAFDLVRQVYPRSEKAPAALLKQSVAYLEVNERARATAALKEILNSYPKSPEAGKAGARLAQLEKKR